MWCRILLWTSLAVVSFCEFGNAQCDVPTSSLKMPFKIGQLKPQNYPTDFPGGQNCVWTFPNNKFSDKALFLFIKEVDLLDGTNSVAYLKIGNENRFVHKPRANCRIYGIKMSDLDLPGLLNYTHHRHEVEGRHCEAWHFDSQPLEQVLFRSFGSGNDSFKNTFFMVYNYISLNKSNTADSPKNPDTEISSKTCKNEPTFTAVIIVLAILLSITCVVLVCLFCKNRKTQNQTFKIAPTVVVADTQAPSDPQNYSNAAYASIDKRVNITPSEPPKSRKTLEQTSKTAATVAVATGDPQNHSNAAYASIDSVNITPNRPPNLQTPMYDVPKNNRPRAPTAVSACSVLSEQHYQVPTSSSAMESESQQLGQGRDVYAVVNKERK